MVLENPKDIILENVEKYFVKIYKKSNYRNSEEDNEDTVLDSDDSNMKIFSKK